MFGQGFMYGLGFWFAGMALYSVGAMLMAVAGYWNAKRKNG